MKKNLTQLIIGLGICGSTIAQTIVTGPTSSQPSYLQPLVPSSTITSIISATNSVNGYSMVGIPDGMGIYDNGDGTFSLIMNHEISSGGGVRAHGSTGAFLSKWVINKSTLAVVSGTDLIQNVNLWTGTTYTTYNATNPSTLTAFSRFCSADMPAVTAFYNAATGLGTQERIYMNGEEKGDEGRALATIATGTNAGNTYELPYLGKASWENIVACPYASNKTIVAGMDDSTPGQVYIYVGTKTNTGNEITKAGLVGGKLYGVSVVGLYNESGSGVPTPGTTFNLVDLGSIYNSLGVNINTASNNLGVTNFLRPEDGAWDPSNPRDLYFNTTNSFTGPSRVWRLRFTDINNPELGGTITAVLDGTEGQKMLDNMTIDHFGNMMLVEDVGNNAHNGKVWQYKIATDALILFAQHDTTRFITGGANFLTIDEEATGIIDAYEILGPGMFLTNDQAHYSVASPIMEGGQLMALYNPVAANSVPEINLTGNNVSIPSGNATVSTGNNTGFGSMNLGAATIHTFAIQNSGPGILTVNGISMAGVNAGDFGLFSLPPFPATIAVNGSLVIYVQFSPGLLGTRTGMIKVMSNDFDESVYTFKIEGTGVAPEINLQGNSVSITDGNTGISATDNTDFGSTVFYTPIIKTFDIQNTGTGTLNISGISITGTNTSLFTLVSPPSFPVTLAGNASLTFSVQYMNSVAGSTNTALININSNDADESLYDFMVEARSLMDVGIKSLSKTESFVNLYPNPAKDEATITLVLDNNQHVVVNVYDIQGKSAMMTIEKELEKGEREITLNTNSLKNGEYFVQVTAGSKSTKIKMVVIH
jgi:hypothetical protein